MSVPLLLQSHESLSFLASATVHTEFPTLAQSILYIVGIIFFLVLNAFFVASEFAIVKVRPSQIETESSEKGFDPAPAMRAVNHLDAYLSATQLGITISSLMLGFLGEPFVSALVSPLLSRTGMPQEAVYWISLILAIASFTSLHVVLGELVPKSVAIRKAVTVTRVIDSPLHWFFAAFRPLIALFQGTANRICLLFGIEPVEEGGHAAHSAEELAILVAQSGQSQVVTETEREILINALNLNELWVRDVMTPRKDVICLDAEQPFDRNIELAIRSKHTRFPLVRGHLDHSIGLIHIKDLFKLINDPDPDLMRIKRDIKAVPDTMPLDSLLEFFLREHAHLALAVDEFGTHVGIVFLDNVMEELVGDIQDEFDNERPSFSRISDHEFIAEGAMTLNDLSGELPDLEIESGEVTTIGGYITQQLGRFPKVGETLEILGYTARVTSTHNNRVSQIHLTKTQPEESAKDDEQTEA